AWDTVRVQDPYQSWFLVYVNANGGELWGTRNALRFSVTNPQWVCVARGFGGGLFNSIDVEFSRDLEHCYISAGSGVYRIDGLGSVYSSDPSFVAKVGYVGTGTTGTVPTYTTSTKITNTGYEGIALNPNDADDLLFLPGFSGSLKRATDASTAGANAVNTTTLVGAGVACYDGIIDRDNPDIIVLGTASGVLVSETGGLGTNAWTNSSAGFEGTPVFEVRQSWRSWEEGNGRPGEIYIGTFGRGIWSSASYLGINDNNNNVSEFKTKLKAYPNPTNDNTNISFKLAQTGNVDLAVYSLSGRLMKTISKKNLPAGENNVFIDCEDLSNGTYIVKLVSGKQVESVKFIKM
ncbi:MAG: T9SS type A sorting domain-containing protein, partial [Bacteroidota bacterium]